MGNGNPKSLSQLTLLAGLTGLSSNDNCESAAESVAAKAPATSDSHQLAEQAGPKEKMAHCGEAAYVASLMMLYLDLPDTPLRPGPQDRFTARTLYHDGVPLTLAESALLLASLRRLIRDHGRPPLPPIRSLAYFQPVITELQQQRLPDGYLDYLRRKFQKAVARP